MVLFSCKYSYLKDIVAITVLKVRLIIKCINLRNYRPINDEVLDDLESITVLMTVNPSGLDIANQSKGVVLKGLQMIISYGKT